MGGKYGQLTYRTRKLKVRHEVEVYFPLPRILLENGGDFYWTLGAGFDRGFEGLRRIRANAEEAWLMIFCL
jgi:hypothetical protein